MDAAHQLGREFVGCDLAALPEAHPEAPEYPPVKKRPKHRVRAMLRTETTRAMAALAHDHGAGIEFRPTGSGHFRAVLSLRGRSRVVTISKTPHSSNLKRALGDARRALRELSA
jgi:hypothetical protein